MIKLGHLIFANDRLHKSPFCFSQILNIASTQLDQVFRKYSSPYTSINGARIFSDQLSIFWNSIHTQTKKRIVNLGWFSIVRMIQWRGYRNLGWSTYFCKYWLLLALHRHSQQRLPSFERSRETSKRASKKWYRRRSILLMKISSSLKFSSSCKPSRRRAEGNRLGTFDQEALIFHSPVDPMLLW